VRRGQNRRERVWAVRHQDNRVCVAFYAKRSIGSRFLRMADTVIKAEIAKHNSRELNGIITNDKFCCTRWSQLQLSWWRRPLRLRQESDHERIR
jgi:hypothetical protein